jgi:hypothetical protein
MNRNSGVNRAHTKSGDAATINGYLTDARLHAAETVFSRHRTYGVVATCYFDSTRSFGWYGARVE